MPVTKVRASAYDAMLALPDDAPALEDIARELRRLRLDAGLRAVQLEERLAAERARRPRAA